MPQEIYSADIREIIAYKPVWIVRHGIMLFLFILLAMVGVSVIVQYPDVVQANATLTSINAPREVKAKSGGLLVKLLVKEGDEVKQNQPLGFLESTGAHEDVLKISSTFHRMLGLIDAGNEGKAIETFDQCGSSSMQLGELSAGLVEFDKTFRDFKQYLNTGYFTRRRAMLRTDVGYLKKLKLILQQQKKMQQQDVDLAKTSLDAQSSLDRDRVISRLDYRNEQSKYIGKAMSIPQVNASIVSNEAAQHDKAKEIAQLDNEFNQQKETLRQAAFSFIAILEEWKAKYIFTAPIDGVCRFSNFVQEKQHIITGQTICFINPFNSIYYAQVNIPQNNFGKIMLGQAVKLKFPSYPFQEFGTLTGSLNFISTMATDSCFLAKVILPNGLNTNYEKTLTYSNGLKAQAEIITKNRSLADRIFSNLVSAFKN